MNFGSLATILSPKELMQQINDSINPEEIIHAINEALQDATESPNFTPDRILLRIQISINRHQWDTIVVPLLEAAGWKIFLDEVLIDTSGFRFIISPRGDAQ